MEDAAILTMLSTAINGSSLIKGRHVLRLPCVDSILCLCLQLFLDTKVRTVSCHTKSRQCFGLDVDGDANVLANACMHALYQNTACQ